MDEIQFCPKTYVRRKKRKNTQHDTKANNVSVDQTSTTPINGSNQEFVSSSIPSFCPSLIGRLLHGQGMPYDSFEALSCYFLVAMLVGLLTSKIMVKHAIKVVILELIF